MAESQKAGTSSVKPKEKTSELDLDFGKDFMSSWKDDGMDFDFGSPAKGKKTTFDFGKLDMDFNLDDDFNKLSSFKMDMADLDISTPQKNAGKEKAQSNQVSASESSRKKKDKYAFSFDFNEFEDLNFETNLEKGSVRSNKSKIKEVLSSQSGSGDLGADLAKDNVPMEDDISSKLQEERGVDPSEMDTEVDNVETADTKDEDGCLKSLTEDSFTQIPAISEENYTIETNTPANTNSVTILEKEQDKQQLENVSPAEAYDPELVQDLSCQSKADHASTQNTPSDLDEEVLIPANVNPRESGEQKVSEKLIGPESNNGSSRDESVPSESVKNSQTENGDGSKFTAVNDVNNTTDSSELTHSEFEHHSIPNDSKKLLQGPMANERNENSALKLLVTSAKSGTAKNDSVPEIEKGSSMIQSKYFKRPTETESQSQQQASISQKKLISTDTKRISTTHVNLVNEKVSDPKATQNGICLASVSRPQPRKLGGEPVHTGNLEGLKGVDINRDRDFPIANTIQHGSKLMGTSRTNDQDLSKEGVALIRNGKNIEDPTALSSCLHPSSSNGQENPSLKSSLDFRLPVPSITSTQNMTKPFPEKNVISPVQAGRRTPELPALKNLRTTGGKLEPVNSALLKGIKSTSNLGKSMEVQENIGSKKTISTDTKKQTPPTLTLKRKAFEDSDAAKLAFTPSKRLSASPSENRYVRAPSDKVVNEKAFDHENVVGDKSRNALKDCQTPTVDIPLDSNYTELETTLSLETESNIEKAEALSKELEHICNMLKKKHEEAKEILVRAVVNNNNLLMLNHPMHLEKIRMVKKFAALLVSK